ncbi:sensor histidine kinase [Planomonospora venezuelensis]|uniref:Signal transduction histidine kinase n=1 Tax=Planomonospora venezuelensis TaxID=1999 RepID=A0A841DFG6_PLAVE|nr:sensor histidine kinase [Planomonospora venezuelensis]MBB5967473.1 signal transduction histidine kinase [Planomonospora venezuelensis]
MDGRTGPGFAGRISALVAFVLLTSAVAAVYFGLGSLGIDKLVAALAAGALFHPLRLRLLELTDRLLTVERDPYRLAGRLAQGVQAASGPGEALASGIAAVRQALRADGVLVEVEGVRLVDGTTGPDGTIGPDGTTGPDGDGTRTAPLAPLFTPLVWHGRPVGGLTVWGARPDRELLDLLARHLAEVAHAVQLTGDLARAHERLLATREEERRRLLGVLDDGLGSTLGTLVAMVAEVRAAPAAAGAGDLLLRARRQLAESIESVRDLVYGLHAAAAPPAPPRTPAAPVRHVPEPTPLPVSWRRRTAVAAAWAGAVLAPLAVCMATWLAWKNSWGGVLQVPVDPVGLLFPAAGAFLITYRPRLTVAWLLWGTGVSWALYELAYNIAYWIHLHDPGHPLLPLTGWLGLWLWMPPVSAMGGLLPLLYPDGRLPSPRWRPVLWGVVALGVTHSFLMACIPQPELELGMPFDNPLAIDALGTLPWTVETHIGWAMLPLYTLSAVSLAFRYRAADPGVRRQIAWCVGTMGAFMGFWVARTLFSVDGEHLALEMIQLLIAGGVPISIVAAVLRHRFYGIRVVLNRTLVYGTLTVVLAAGYTFMIWTGDRLAGGFGPAAGLVAVMSVGALFQPVRRRLQGPVDRLFGVERDPYRAADRLSRTVQEAGDPAEALATAVSVLRWSLGARGAGVEVDGELFADGALGDRPRSLPLVWHGEDVGRLLVPGPRKGGESLAVMSTHLAELAHAVRLAADLRRSRERIRAAREEERRWLGRELHDGLGPALTGAVLMLDAARRDPAGGRPLLARIEADLAATAVSVRELVAGLRPPVLDHLGLEGALRAAAQVPGVRVEVEVEVEAGGDLPPSLELAAYRIVQEALTNVRRHARADVARVVVTRAGDGPGDGPGGSGGLGGELVVRVEDDGVGMPARHTPGVGLASMHERTAEVGGTCAVQARPGGGTVVTARLPLAAAGVAARP